MSQAIKNISLETLVNKNKFYSTPETRHYKNIAEKTLFRFIIEAEIEGDL